jgi:hypothetical protein
MEAGEITGRKIKEPKNQICGTIDYSAFLLAAALDFSFGPLELASCLSSFAAANVVSFSACQKWLPAKAPAVPSARR